MYENNNIYCACRCNLCSAPASDEKAYGEIKWRGKPPQARKVKKRWNAKTYKHYQVNLRKVEDAELIKAVEAMREHIGLSDIFRLGIKTAIKENLSGAFEDTAE